MTQTIYIVSIGLICIVGLVYAIYLLKNPSNRDSLRIAPIDQDTDGNGWYKMNSMPGGIRTFNPETDGNGWYKMNSMPGGIRTFNPETDGNGWYKMNSMARKIRFKDFL